MKLDEDECRHICRAALNVAVRLRDREGPVAADSVAVFGEAVKRWLDDFEAAGPEIDPVIAADLQRSWQGLPEEITTTWGDEGEASSSSLIVFPRPALVAFFVGRACLAGSERGFDADSVARAAETAAVLIEESVPTFMVQAYKLHAYPRKRESDRDRLLSRRIGPETNEDAAFEGSMVEHAVAFLERNPDAGPREAFRFGRKEALRNPPPFRRSRFFCGVPFLTARQSRRAAVPAQPPLTNPELREPTPTTPVPEPARDVKSSSPRPARPAGKKVVKKRAPVKKRSPVGKVNASRPVKKAPSYVVSPRVRLPAQFFTAGSPPNSELGAFTLDELRSVGQACLDTFVEAYEAEKPDDAAMKTVFDVAGRWLTDQNLVTETERLAALRASRDASDAIRFPDEDFEPREHPADHAAYATGYLLWVGLFPEPNPDLDWDRSFCDATFLRFAVIFAASITEVSPLQFFLDALNTTNDTRLTGLATIYFALAESADFDDEPVTVREAFNKAVAVLHAADSPET